MQSYALFTELPNFSDEKFHKKLA